MKIEKHVEISKLMDIDVSSEDIKIIFDGDPDNVHHIMHQIQNFYQFMNGVSDKKIDEMTHEQKRITHRFFKEQSERFEEKVKKCRICGGIACQEFDEMLLCDEHYKKLVPDQFQDTSYHSKIHEITNKYCFPGASELWSKSHIEIFDMMIERGLPVAHAFEIIIHILSGHLDEYDENEIKERYLKK